MQLTVEILKKILREEVEKALREVNNPWAICTDSIAKTAGTTERSEWSESEMERYERCVKDVKKGD
jgi:hypothetical protein